MSEFQGATGPRGGVHTAVEVFGRSRCAQCAALAFESAPDVLLLNFEFNSRPAMRRLIALAILLIALPVAAQQRPPKLEPLPPPPPPPAGLEEQAPGGPEVTITPEQGQIVEEYLVDGKRRVRVRMPNGAEYVLEEDLGDGTSARQESGDSGLRVPRWIIIRF